MYKYSFVPANDIDGYRYQKILAGYNRTFFFIYLSYRISITHVKKCKLR